MRLTDKSAPARDSSAPHCAKIILRLTDSPAPNWGEILRPIDSSAPEIILRLTDIFALEIILRLIDNSAPQIILRLTNNSAPN